MGCVTNCLHCCFPPRDFSLGFIVVSHVFGKTFLNKKSFSIHKTICCFCFLYSVFNEHLSAHLAVIRRADCSELLRKTLMHEELFALSSHLSHSRGEYPFGYLVGPSRLELPTSCLSGTRSNLLSYEPMWLGSDRVTWSSTSLSTMDDGIRSRRSTRLGRSHWWR